jgi:hypothetical protein
MPTPVPESGIAHGSPYEIRTPRITLEDDE